MWNNRKFIFTECPVKQGQHFCCKSSLLFLQSGVWACFLFVSSDSLKSEPTTQRIKLNDKTVSFKQRCSHESKYKTKYNITFSKQRMHSGETHHWRHHYHSYASNLRYNWFQGLANIPLGFKIKVSVSISSTVTAPIDKSLMVELSDLDRHQNFIDFSQAPSERPVQKIYYKCIFLDILCQTDTDKLINSRISASWKIGKLLCIQDKIVSACVKKLSGKITFNFL